MFTLLCFKATQKQTYTLTHQQFVSCYFRHSPTQATTNSATKVVKSTQRASLVGILYVTLEEANLGT